MLVFFNFGALIYRAASA